VSGVHVTATKPGPNFIII